MHLKQQKTMVLNKVLNEKLVNSKCLINCFLLPKIRPKLYRLGELLGKSAMLKICHVGIFIKALKPFMNITFILRNSSRN